MSVYKIKHMPTGLYYTPYGINLTKKGKKYNTKDNILTHSKYDIFINTKNKSIYNTLKKLFYKESNVK